MCMYDHMCLQAKTDSECSKQLRIKGKETYFCLIVKGIYNNYVMQHSTNLQKYKSKNNLEAMKIL